MLESIFAHLHQTTHSYFIIFALLLLLLLSLSLVDTRKRERLDIYRERYIQRY